MNWSEIDWHQVASEVREVLERHGAIAGPAHIEGRVRRIAQQIVAEQQGAPLVEVLAALDMVKFTVLEPVFGPVLLSIPERPAQLLSLAAGVN